MGERGAPDRDPVTEAQAAAERGDWQVAFELLTTAVPFLAEVAYAAGHLDVTIATWERAHLALLRSGESVPAAGAAVRVAMHLLFDTALMAPVRGWLSR